MESSWIPDRQDLHIPSLNKSNVGAFHRGQLRPGKLNSIINTGPGDLQRDQWLFLYGATAYFSKGFQQGQRLFLITAVRGHGLFLVFFPSFFII